MKASSKRRKPEGERDESVVGKNKRKDFEKNEGKTKNPKGNRRRVQRKEIYSPQLDSQSKSKSKIM